MCENLRGSYRCICNLGYEAAAAGKECMGERARQVDGQVGGPPPLHTPHPALPPSPCRCG